MHTNEQADSTNQEHRLTNETKPIWQADESSTKNKKHVQKHKESKQTTNEKQTNKRANKQANKHTSEQKHKQTNKQIVKQTDTQSKKQTSEQTQQTNERPVVQWLPRTRERLKSQSLRAGEDQKESRDRRGGSCKCGHWRGLHAHTRRRHNMGRRVGGARSAGS